MNDNDISNLPGIPSQKQAPKCGKKKCALWIVLFLVLLLVAVGAACQYWRMQTSMATQDVVEIQQRLTGLENSVRALDERVDVLSNAAPQAPTASGETPSATTKQSVQDIARLQSDLVAVSSALTMLQNEVKETRSHAQHSQQATQSTLASAIAYIQLRSVALSDQPFTAELSAMRDASPDDTDFQKALGKLEPYAASGAPTASQLRDDLMSLESSASAAIDKQAAQNWWEKFVAELKGLVSVRHIHGGGTDTFAKMHWMILKICQLTPKMFSMIGSTRSKHGKISMKRCIIWQIILARWPNHQHPRPHRDGFSRLFAAPCDFYRAGRMAGGSPRYRAYCLA
jgi:hypothetical protein